MAITLFFDKDIKNCNQDEYLYSDDYVYYFISELIFKEGGVGIGQITNKLNSFFDIKIIVGTLSDFLSNHFIYKSGVYYLKKYQEVALNKIEKEEKFLTEEIKNENEIYKYLNNYLKNQMFDVVEASQYIYYLYKNNCQNNVSILLSKYYSFILNKDKYYRELDFANEEIDSFYCSFDVFSLFDDEIIKKTLYMFQINTVSQLKQKSIDFLLCVFSYDIKKCLEIFTSLKKINVSEFKNIVCNIFNSLNSQRFYVICERNGLKDGVEHTLEECAQTLGLTRERVRQIEAKTTEEILKKSSNIYFQFLSIFYNITYFKKNYITKDELEIFMGDALITNYITFIIKKLDYVIKYTDEYAFFYNSVKTNEDDIVSAIIDEIGEIVKFEDTINYNNLYKKIIRNNYRQYSGVYAKKGITINDLIAIVVSEEFPDGYKAGNNNSYLILKQKYEQKFGVWEKFPSMHSLSGRLERSDFCLVDIGTYKLRSYCVVLPEYLVEEINKYIYDNKPIIFYRSIYEHFKTELIGLGVNNSFYLKGLIDPFINNEFITKRDYIKSSDTDLSAAEAIILTIKSFDSIFSLDDLRNKFKGVKDYVLYNYLYSEECNGLLMLENKRFIYFDKLNIEYKAINELQIFIEDLFKFLSTKFLHASKIYARLSLQKKELLYSLKAESSFSLFSIIKYVFKNDYDFRRPFLFAKTFTGEFNTYSIIINYASSLDYFNKDIVDAYINKMNLRELFDYGEFIEIMSENYVQITNGAMVKKEKIKINDIDLKRLSELLELIISKSGDINTNEFSGYSMLPNLNYPWNKYLLAGVARTFLGEKFIVESYGSDYRIADFIIKKVQN